MLTTTSHRGTYNFKNKGGKKDMKKTPLALFTVVFVTSMCFAEEASAPSNTNNSANPTQVSSDAAAPAQVSNATVSPIQLPDSTTPLAPAETITFTGKVVDIHSVSHANNMRPNPQIIVKGDTGRGAIFTVASDAPIIGKDGNPTTLNWIRKDDKVSVEYIRNQDGTKTAKSIEVSAD